MCLIADLEDAFGSLRDEDVWKAFQPRVRTHVGVAMLRCISGHALKPSWRGNEGPPVRIARGCRHGGGMGGRERRGYGVSLPTFFLETDGRISRIWADMARWLSHTSRTRTTCSSSARARERPRWYEARSSVGVSVFRTTSSSCGRILQFRLGSNRVTPVASIGFLGGLVHQGP